MRVPRCVRPLLRAVLEITWPTDCFVCGEALSLDQCLGACLACWARLAPLRASCSRCGEPTAPSDLVGPPGLPCAGCLLARGLGRRQAVSQLSGVRPAVTYDAVAQRFLLRAKRDGRVEILAVLGVQLASMLAVSAFAADCEAVIPVPSHPLARLRRGFDPARALAWPVAAALGIPLKGALRRRLRRGSAAKRLSAAVRARALEHAFAPAMRRPLPRRVLLVDDVLTTGATAAACVPPLRALGVEEVRVAVWARTPRRAPI